MKTKFFSALAALLLTATSVWSQDVNYTVTKISNPDRGERQADGLIPGGDRENSYTWRLAMRGDEIYIATARNIASVLVNMYGSAFAGAGVSIDTFWAMIDAVSNGDILRNDVSEGANIISYNRTTGEFKVVYTADEGDYFRMAVTYGDNVYFGSYSANPANSQYILRLDTDGNFEKVFETTGSVSLRANCVYDDHLFFGGADDRETVEGSAAKMAILKMSNEDDTVWERVADYRDFGKCAYDPIMSSWAGCPIWELASHNGYIYATGPSTYGFFIYKGRPAQEGETANEYGWHWEEVAGLTNGINNPGLSDVEGGEPGTMRSLIGSVFEFNGELYAYNFDHSFGGEAQAFAGIFQKLAGKDVKACDYLEYMYNSLHNPQKIWKLDDASGKFVECKEFTKLMEGTTNEYIWRMGEYDGQLYISTMDAGIFYGYLTQLTNGSLLKMSKEEIATKVAYINNVIKILAKQKVDEKAAELTAMLTMVKLFLNMYIDYENTDGVLQLIVKYQELANVMDAIIDAYISSHQNDAEETTSDEDKANSIVTMATQLKETLQEIAEKIDVEGIKKYLYINNLVKNDEWGFDLYRTFDGENFETITRNGFNDKYNYGCPSFLATEEGLYIGTCNPFYGGQLYLLKNDNEVNEMKGVIDKTTGIATLGTEGTGFYYDFSGRRLSDKPTVKGLYILNGKKVAVK